jgi:hypothetical protein
LLALVLFKDPGQNALVSLEPDFSLRDGHAHGDGGSGQFDTAMALVQDAVELCVRLRAGSASNESQDVPGALLKLDVCCSHIHHLIVDGLAC